MTMLVSLVLAVITASACSLTQFPSSELSALKDLYNSTHGRDWDWQKPYSITGYPWNFTQNDPCSNNWQGIRCMPISHQSHVIALLLPKHNLQGSIPASIDGLPFLQEMDLSTNLISSTIPASIGNLVSLQDVNLEDNQLAGAVPETVGSLTSIQSLQLSSNKLTHLPSTLSNLPQLALLSVSSNQVGGKIPDWVGLPSLTTLSLDGNRFTGGIPCSLATYTALQSLDLGGNPLQGTVPSCLGALRELQSLELCCCELVGQLPDSLGQLLQLQVLELTSNHLNGSLPNTLGNLVNLTTLSVYYNLQMSGTIPSSLGNLHKLQNLEIYNNLFTGTLPNSLGNLNQLEQFLVFANQLSGTLPASLGNLTLANNFQVYSNHLSGTVPSSLGNMTKTQGLYLQQNKFSGTIPASLSYLPHLRDMYLDDNALTGTLPDALCAIHVLTGYGFATNQLHGSVPACIGNLRRLEYLDLNNNTLSGSLPDSIGHLTRLKELDLEYNHCSGILPKSLANFSQLQVLQVQNNVFSGSLDGVFSPSTQLQLITVQVHNNKFSGSIPGEIFLLSILNNFVATSNCFSGSLPAAVCNATSMDSLVLDGLSSASTCRNLLLPGVSAAYVLHNAVGGNIPACIFQLPSLTTLHLSGNAFSGTLPSNISSVLQDLTAAHNLLTGSIPRAIQERAWTNLDISYNRLGGSLLPTFRSNKTGAAVPSASSLSLQNNRISGLLPGVVLGLMNVSVLGSNMFSCDVAASDLPQHDSGTSTYQCGSNAFNSPYFAWLAVVATALIVGATVAAASKWRLSYESHLHLTRAAENLRAWWYYSCPELDAKPNISGLRRCFVLVGRIATYSVGYILVVLMPAYCALSLYYGTHAHEYAWSISAAFLTGAVAFVTEFVLWMVLVVLLVTLFARQQETHINAGAPANTSAKTDSLSSEAFTPPTTTFEDPPAELSLTDKQKHCIYALYILVDLVVVVGANIAFVYVEIYGTSQLQTAAQILLAFFKLAWNSSCAPALLRYTVLTCAPGLLQADGDRLEVEFASLQIMVALVNNILVPCLVVAGVSPSCFYNVFVPAPLLTSTFHYASCQTIYILSGDCYSYRQVESTTSYTPPFTYSYQCSSSLITYYSPAFVNMCITSVFVNPCIQMVALYLHRRATPRTKWAQLLNSILSPMMRDPPKPSDTADAPQVTTPTSPATSFTDTVVCKSISADPVKPPSAPPTQRYFSAIGIFITLLTNLGLLLTFGAVFPPLAAALTLTVYCTVAFTKMELGRFLRSAVGQRSLQLKYFESIERDCRGVGSIAMLRSLVWMLITISCWFYTLFLFDTLGDAVGFDGAYWVLIVMPLMPLVLYTAYIGVERVLTARQLRRTETGVSNDATSVDADHKMGSAAGQELEMHSMRMHGVGSGLQSSANVVVSEDILQDRGSSIHLQDLFVSGEVYNGMWKNV